jgi:hypothetical protein
MRNWELEISDRLLELPKPKTELNQIQQENGRFPIRETPVLALDSNIPPSRPLLSFPVLQSLIPNSYSLIPTPAKPLD